MSVRNGLSSFDPEQIINSWESHPFADEFEGVPNGWVLESDSGEIVGTFSNVHMMYELDGRRVKAAIAGSWAVDTQHRSSSLLLAMSYFNQKGVDVCLNGSASDVASKLMTAMKAQRIPSPDYDLSYFWITDRQAFASAVCRKKKIPAAALVSRLAAVGLWASDIGFQPKGRKEQVKRLSGFGVEFDELWERLRTGSPRLRAVRTSKALEWRFEKPMRQNASVALGFFDGKALQGYIILVQVVRAHLDLRQFVIADMQAMHDSPEIYSALVGAALDTTKQAGMAALEWRGWHSSKRTVAVSLRPKSYRSPVWPLYYKPRNPDMAVALSSPDSWDFSPFDAY